MPALRACWCSRAAYAIVATDCLIFFVELKPNGCFYPAGLHSRSRHHTLREFEGLRGPDFFEAVVYTTPAVGDAGGTGLLVLSCCVNDGREERSCSSGKRRTIGKKTIFHPFACCCSLPTPA